MKFYLQLKCTFIWDATLVIYLDAHAQLSPWQLHPCVPSLVARTVPGMVHVFGRCSHGGAPLGEGFHRSHADVSLFGILGTDYRFGYQSQQRTFCAAVGLHRWQLNHGDVTSRHCFSVLSGKYCYNVGSVLHVVGMFHDTLLCRVGKNATLKIPCPTERRASGFPSREGSG